MANIRIVETGTVFMATVDEYPEISVVEKSFEAARDRAVTMVKAELSKIEAPKTEERETSRIKIGFAA